MSFGWISRCVSAAVVSLGALLSACGGGGGGTPAPTPPTISNLFFGPQVVPASSGTISVLGSLDFTDSGGDLSTLNVTVVDARGQQISSATASIQGAAGLTSGSITGSVQVDASVVGFYTVQVSISDAAGSTSNVLSGTFQVVAVAGQGTPVATTGPAPQGLTVAGGVVYWSDAGEDVLRSVPVTGGGATVHATKMTNPLSIAFVGSDVIWLDDRGVAPGICSSASVNRVLKRTAADGTTRVLASGPACRGGANEVVVIGSTAYWVSSVFTPDTWTINATPIDGGTTTPVAAGLVPVVMLIGRAGTLYWMENNFATTSSAIRSMPGGGGAVTTIASGFDSAANTFAVDGNAVYYTTPNYPRVVPPFSETLVAQPLAGGAASMLSPAIPTPVKIVSTGASVAWLDEGALRSIPAGGGSVTPLAPTTGTPIDLLFDGTNLLWTESTAPAPNAAGAIRSVSPAGGPFITLYEGDAAPRRMAIDPSARLNWTAGSIDALTDGSARIARLDAGNTVETVVAGLARDSAPFAVTATDLIVADLERIKRIPLAGGMPTTVAVDDSPIANIATDGAAVYWNTGDTGSLRKAPIGGGAVTVLVSLSALGSFAGAPGPIRLATNGNLYWVANSTNVLSAPSATPSAAPTPIAQGLAGISDLVVDAARAYVALPATGDILSMPLAGGATTQLAHLTPAPPAGFRLALDGSTLFWFGNLKVAQLPVDGGPSTEVLEFDAGNAFGFAVDADNVYFALQSPLAIRKSPRL